jgi:hypothetical protein
MTREEKNTILDKVGRGMWKNKGCFLLISWARIVFGIPVLFLLAGCPVFDSRPGPAGPSVSGVFKARRGDNFDSLYEVKALKLAEGTRCVVYASEDQGIPAGTAKAIANEYDYRIYPKISGVFGDYLSTSFDVDGNGKTILLLLDIKDGYTGSGGYVAGYFDYSHLFRHRDSNLADMLFIDVNPQIPGTPGFYATIAHELQHLISYVLHAGQSAQPNPQELWLNEGLSAAAEYLYSGHQQGRINDFNKDHYGTIAQGNNFFVWQGGWEEGVKGDLLANYATVYLFFQWLRIHGGPGIYTAISKQGETGYKAVAQAARDCIHGFADGSDEEIWDRLLSSWMIANLLNAPARDPQDPAESSLELYGYRGEITTEIHYFAEKGKRSMALAPGEGIFSLLDTAVTADDSGNIKYLGIDPETETVSRSAPYAKVLLTYNANPDTSGESEQGYVSPFSAPQPGGTGSTAGTAAGNSRALSPAGAGLPRSYPIGAYDLWARRSAERLEVPADPPGSPSAE